MGKTTVLDLWLARRAADGAVRVARGQCVEHLSEGEPYLPVLAALGQLGHQPGAREFLAVLRQYAPLWLVHLPGLVREPERDQLQRQVQGATQARMLRELVEALDALTAEQPLVLVLEDLHWSDTATVECLSAVAQGRSPRGSWWWGRIGRWRRCCGRIPCAGGCRNCVGGGMAWNCAWSAYPPRTWRRMWPDGWAGRSPPRWPRLYTPARTAMRCSWYTCWSIWCSRAGWCGARGSGRWRDATAVGSLPEGLRHLLLRRIEALAPAVRRVLEAASVVGETFAVAAVAAGAQCPVEDVEAVCEALAAQQHVLDETGLTDWPDGTSGGSYRFRHALYQQVLYEQVGLTRRRHLHQRIGARLEAGYGAAAGEVAAHLAVHCERGGEILRAVHYWQQVGDNATRRQAYPDALTAYTKGRTLLATLPDSPARAQHELTLLLTLGGLLMAVQGMRAPDAGAVYTRAQALAHQVGAVPQRFRALWGLVAFHRAQGQLQTASALSQQLCALAQDQPDPGLVLASHVAMGELAFYQGDLRAARTHLEQSLRLADPWQPAPTPPWGAGAPGHRPGLAGAAAVGVGVCRPGAAAGAGGAGAGAPGRAHPQSGVCSALYDPARPVLPRRPRHARPCGGRDGRGGGRGLGAARRAGAHPARVGAGHAGRHGHRPRGHPPRMHGAPGHGLPAVQSLFFRVVGGGLWAGGAARGGVAGAGGGRTLVATTEERWWEAELYRLQGTLLLQLPSPAVDQADACFQQALAVARRQQAKSLELRAATSLSRLWQQQGKRAEAHALLAPIYGWFTEGFDTADLQEARGVAGGAGGMNPMERGRSR